MKLGFVNKKIFFLLVFVFLASCSNDKPELLGKKNYEERILKRQSLPKTALVIEDWFFVKENNKCFIATFPVSTASNKLDRDSNYMLITKNKNDYELVIVGGAKYNQDSFVRMQIQKSNIFLNVVKEQAWAENEELIIKEFSEAYENYILVFSTFFDGTKATDKYSLNGFKESFNRLKSC
jgi:hypothetical protein